MASKSPLGGVVQSTMRALKSRIGFWGVLPVQLGPQGNTTSNFSDPYITLPTLAELIPHLWGLGNVNQAPVVRGRGLGFRV